MITREFLTEALLIALKRTAQDDEGRLVRFVVTPTHAYRASELLLAMIETGHMYANTDGPQA